MTQDQNPLSPETIKAAVSQIMVAAGADPDLAQYTVQLGLFGEAFAIPADIYTLIAFHQDKPPACIFPGDVYVGQKRYWFRDCDEYGIRGESGKIRYCIHHTKNYFDYGY